MGAAGGLGRLGVGGVVVEDVVARVGVGSD